MRIYTVTYLINNYGSVLQAYALQSRIKEFGAEPYIIKKNVHTNFPVIHALIKVIKPEKNYSLIQRIKKVIGKKAYKEKWKKLQFFIKDNINVLSISDTDGFLQQITEKDIFLAGSDQIWSVALSPLSRWYSLQWAKNVSNKKFSYSASIGVDKLSREQVKDYSVSLSCFEMISLRESHAVNLLECVFHDKIRQDLDPTLLYDGDYWRKLKSPSLSDVPYIFVYMLRPDNRVIELARKVASRMLKNALKHNKTVLTGIRHIGDLFADGFNEAYRKNIGLETMKAQIMNNYHFFRENDTVCFHTAMLLINEQNGIFSNVIKVSASSKDEYINSLIEDVNESYRQIAKYEYETEG